MSSGEQAKPYLGRCNECDYALFVQADEVITATTLKEVRAGEAPRRMADNGAVLARCPKRHRVFRLKQIKGKYSDKHKCNATCQNAKGNDCTCSCGGMNHGRGYAVQVMTLKVDPPTTMEAAIGNYGHNEPIQIGHGQTAPGITPDQADRKEGHVTHDSDEPSRGQRDYIANLTAELGIPLPHVSNRAHASEIINALKADVLDQRPMTDNQRSLINRLLEQRSMALEARREARRQLDAGLSQGKASAWIDKLLTLPEIAS